MLARFSIFQRQPGQSPRRVHELSPTFHRGFIAHGALHGSHSQQGCAISTHKDKDLSPRESIFHARARVPRHERTIHRRQLREQAHGLLHRRSMDSVKGMRARKLLIRKLWRKTRSKASERSEQQSSERRGDETTYSCIARGKTSASIGENVQRGA